MTLYQTLLSQCTASVVKHLTDYYWLDEMIFSAYKQTNPDRKNRYNHYLKIKCADLLDRMSSLKSNVYYSGKVMKGYMEVWTFLCELNEPIVHYITSKNIDDLSEDEWDEEHDVHG